MTEGELVDARTLRRLWLYRLWGLGPRDLTRRAGNLRAVAAITAWVGALAGLSSLWAALFGFLPELSAGDLPMVLGPLLALTWCMALQVYWSAIAFPLEFLAALPAYAKKDEVRFIGATLLRRWLSGGRAPLVGVLFGTAIVLLAFVRGGQSDSLIVSSFGRAWFDHAAVAKLVLSALWAAILGALLFTGSSALWGFWQLFIRVSEADTVDVPVFVLPRVRHLVLLGEFVGAAWAADVLLAYVATFNRAGMLSAAFVAGATVIGFATLVLPHLSIHLSLRRMEHRITAQMAVLAKAVLGSGSAAEDLRVLGEISSDLKSTWPYDLGFVAPFALAQFATAAVGLLGVAIK